MGNAACLPAKSGTHTPEFSTRTLAASCAARSFLSTTLPRIPARARPIQAPGNLIDPVAQKMMSYFPAAQLCQRRLSAELGRLWRKPQFQ